MLMLATVVLYFYYRFNRFGHFQLIAQHVKILQFFQINLFYCYFIFVLVIIESAASGYLGGGGLGTPHTWEE